MRQKPSASFGLHVDRVPVAYHRICDLYLLDEGWDIGQIINALSVTSDIIRQWQDNYKTYGCVNPSSVLQGHHRLLNTATIMDLHKFIQESPSLFLDEIAKWLALYHDLPISITALHDNL
jgi:transposase